MDKKTRDVIRLLCNMPVKPVNPFRGDGGFRSPSDATPLGSKSPAERAKETAEETRIAIRNIRRDGNRHADGIAKTMSEDDLKKLKEEIQSLTKSFEEKVDASLEQKTKELTTM